MTSTTKAINTGKSITNDNGFIRRRSGTVTYYVRDTGDERTIWVSRVNPTVSGSKQTDGWGVYVTFHNVCGVKREATAQGFKTHGDAERWANENVK